MKNGINTIRNISNVGADIEDVARFGELRQIKDFIFLRKIYTENELKYCFRKAAPAQHLAVRFAGKEAILKALNGMGVSSVSHNEIEILNNSQGAPRVIFNKRKNLEKLNVRISLSHCRDKALALVVVNESI